MTKRLVFTVGNTMMGDDAAGPLLAEMIEQNPLPGWDVLDGGIVPESYLYKIREMAPQQVLLVDSAEMGLPPGKIQSIPIADPFIMTTHSLPLTYLVEAIREFVPEVELVGIQPEVVAFGYPVSEKVKDAVEAVYERLKERGESESIRPVKNNL
jgi:hydrogenase 3 maturation protease